MLRRVNRVIAAAVPAVAVAAVAVVAGGGGGGQTGNGGLNFVTTTNNTVNVSLSARNFFTTLGVNLFPPKSIFFNDRLGLLFVRATMQDLDTIESAIQALNQVAPQVHIKSRFIRGGTGRQRRRWALTGIWDNLTSAIPSSPRAAARRRSMCRVRAASRWALPRPHRRQPDCLLGNGPANNQRSQQFGAPAPLATITGILTNPNFRVVLHALEQRTGVEELAEPEVTTTSGRQTEMRATEIITVITGFNFQQGRAATTTGTGTP